MRRPVLLVFVALALAACEEAPATASWRTEVAAETGTKLGGCAIGDVDPTHAGNEIVAVGADGRVHVIAHTSEGWHASVAADAPGELIQVAVGDLLPDVPGAEIVAVGVTKGHEGDAGAKGAAVLVKRQGEGWHQERLFEDAALLHGVGFALGGVVVAGYSNEAHLIAPDGEGWKVTKIAELPGPGRSVVATRDGAAIACRDGSVVLIKRATTSAAFGMTEVDRRSAGRARVGAHGGDIVVSDDDGTLSLLSETVVRIHKEAAALRGAVLADLDPACPGLEAATAGYGKTVTLLRERGEAWVAEAIARDAESLHHLTAGVLPGHEGLCLVTCGFGGRVLVLAR